MPKSFPTKNFQLKTTIFLTRLIISNMLFIATVYVLKFINYIFYEHMDTIGKSLKIK